MGSVCSGVVLRVWCVVCPGYGVCVLWGVGVL